MRAVCPGFVRDRSALPGSRHAAWTVKQPPSPWAWRPQPDSHQNEHHDPQATSLGVGEEAHGRDSDQTGLEVSQKTREGEHHTVTPPTQVFLIAAHAKPRVHKMDREHAPPHRFAH